MFRVYDEERLHFSTQISRMAVRNICRDVF